MFEVEPAVRIEDQARYLGTTDIKPIEIPPFIPKHKIEDDIRLKDNRYQEVKEDLNLRLKDTDTQTDEQYLSPRTMSDKGHLMSLIPQGKYLPDAPLRLSGSDQSKLFNLVQKELTKKNFDPSRLKSLYLDITAFDKNLVGYCSFQDISFTFTKHQVRISISDCFILSFRYNSKIVLLSFLNFSTGVIWYFDPMVKRPTGHFTIWSNDPRVRFFIWSNDLPYGKMTRVTLPYGKMTRV